MEQFAASLNAVSSDNKLHELEGETLGLAVVNGATCLVVSR